MTYQPVTIDLNRRASSVEAQASVIRRTRTGSFTPDAGVDAARHAARKLAAEAAALADALEAGR
jgi:plasmid stabilization system protein ParE